MRYLLIILTTLLNVSFAQPAVDPAEVDEFIAFMVTEHQFDQEQLTELLNNVEMPKDVIERLDNLRARLSQPQSAKAHHIANKPLYEYRAITLTPERISGGVNFWHANKITLERMQQEYGIPPQIVLAIISNETDYGRFIGKHNALNALYTHAFYHPSRREFFQRELSEFLLLAREQQWDSKNMISSFDGGLGIAQFMPSSYRAYAIDFNNDGNINLYQPEDAIGSIANYLTIHGWEFDGPIIVPANVSDADLEKIDELAIGPTHPNSGLDRIGEYHSLAEFAQDKIYPDYEKANMEPLENDQQAILIKMEIEPEVYAYWLAFNNFSVITRYNTRREYAKTIHELSDRIQKHFISDVPTQFLSTLHPKLPGLIDNIATEYELDKVAISQLFSEVIIACDFLRQYQQHKQQTVSWSSYKRQHVTLNNIFNGAYYWQQHREVLARAEANYGIPAKIIVALIGMANNYQSKPYAYNALQVLTTLALCEHDDQEKYRKELGIFLSLAKKEKLNVAEVSSTVDGRIGILAWLPSTYKNYAIDFSGNGQRNLINNSTDAIGSAANYIKELGWQSNGLIAVAALVNGENFYDIVNDSRQPNRSLAQLKEFGVIPETPVEDNPQAMLIGVQDDLLMDYWLGFHNFYVLSRINRDAKFVLALEQLSTSVVDEYQRLQLLLPTPY